MRRLIASFVLAPISLVALVATAVAQTPSMPGGGDQAQCQEGCGGGSGGPVITLIAPAPMPGSFYEATPYIEVDWCDNNFALVGSTRWIKLDGVTKTSSFTYQSATGGSCAGDHYKSTTTSVSISLGTHTLSAYICNDELQCTQNAWLIERLPGPTPIVSLAPYNADVQDYSRCALNCFAATYTQATTPYYSLDTPRNVVLVYNSDRADPRPFVHVDVTHGGSSGNLPNYFYLKMQRVGANNIQFLNGETELRFAASAGAALRLGGQFSAATNGMTSDSVYQVNVIVGADYAAGRQETVVSTRVIVVNRPAAIGVARGWGIAGIQRLVPVTNGALVIEGDGSAFYFAQYGSAFTTPTGDFSTLTKSGSGTGTTYIRAYPDSTKVTFDYQGRMTTVTNAFGNANTVTYDGSGRVFLIKDPLNAYSAMHYGTYGVDRIVSLNYTYTTVAANGTLTSIQDADSISTRFVYDANLRLSRIVNRLGDTVSTIGYHAYSNRVLADSGPPISVYPSGTARSVITLDPWQQAGVPYQSTANAPYFSPPQASTVRATVTDAGGHATRFTVNAFGQPLVTSGALSDTVTVAYSSAGLPTSVTPSLGVASSYAYNTSGLPTSVTIGGLVRNFNYMAYGIASRDSGDAGPVRRDTLIMGSRIVLSTVGVAPSDTVRLDVYGRDSTVRDDMGHLIVQRAFNGPLGNVSRDSSAGGYVRIYGYDSWGRLSWDSTPNYRRRNIRTYDALNRVIEVRDTAGAAPTTYGYDGLYLRSVTDPLGNRDSTYYNALGWPVVHVDHTGKRDSILYDVEGLVRRTRSRDTARVDTVRYAYDAGHRLRSRRGPFIVSDTISYAGDSVVAVANANSRITTYLGGVRRQVDSVVTWLRLNGTDSTRYVQRYAYRSAGVARSLLDSTWVPVPANTFRSRRFGYHTTQFTTDSLWFGGALTRITHGNDFQVTGMAFPGGDTYTRTVLGSHATGKDSSSVFWDRYSVAGGRLLADQRVNQNRGVTWSYDNGGHLGESHFGGLSCTSDSEIGHTCTWTWRDSTYVRLYDALGNVIRTRDYSWLAHSGDSMLTWSDTAVFGPMNRLSTGGGCSYTYDGRGSMIRRLCGSDSTLYTWNGDRQLISLRAPDGTTFGFAYDPLGRVVRRSVNGTVSSSFLWDGDRLHAELSTSGTMLGEYSYYEVDNLHAFVAGGNSTTYYALHDQIGSVRGYTTGSYADPGYYVFDDFGGTVSSLPPLGGSAYARVQWKGALNLAPEAGLYYMRNRWYDTRTGRFISEDPLGLLAGSNLYTYAGGDPVNGVDPTGLRYCVVTGRDSHGNVTSYSCHVDPGDCQRSDLGPCLMHDFQEFCRRLGGVVAGDDCAFDVLIPGPADPVRRPVEVGSAGVGGQDVGKQAEQACFTATLMAEGSTVADALLVLSGLWAADYGLQAGRLAGYANLRSLDGVRSVARAVGLRSLEIRDLQVGAQAEMVLNVNSRMGEAGATQLRTGSFSVWDVVPFVATGRAWKSAWGACFRPGQ